MGESSHARERRIQRQKDWYAKQDPAVEKAKRAAYYAANKKRLRKASREWALANPEKVKANQARWRSQNKIKLKALNQKSRLKCNYGLTIAQLNEMFDAQGRQCKCCGSADPKTMNGWHVDHCHVTGVVRGVLCQLCNVMLGAARDTPEILERGAEYLRASGGVK